ncbi:MAG TPA: hypothetical protein PK263_03650 [bacterium]|nr:hypothetical protein [bacterium]
MVEKIQNLLVTRVSAADIGINIPGGMVRQPGPDGKCVVAATNVKDYDWGCYVESIYRFALSLGIWVAIAMICYASYKILFSQGDTSKTKEGKDIILGTLLGFLLLWIIGILLDFIGLPKYNT